MQGNRDQPSSAFSHNIIRLFSQLSSQSTPDAFGIAFDIDGVVLRSEAPIGGSPRAFRRLYDDSGNLRIPYVFLTNGGGISESKRALELSSLLGVKISPLQVLQGHTPFKQLLNRFENELIVRFLSKTKYFTVQNQKLERTSIASISPDHEIP